MDNIETQSKLGIIHRTKTNKTNKNQKQNQKQNKNTIQKTKKMSNTGPTKNPPNRGI